MASLAQIADTADRDSYAKSQKGETKRHSSIRALETIKIAGDVIEQVPVGNRWGEAVVVAALVAVRTVDPGRLQENALLSARLARRIVPRERHVH